MASCIVPGNVNPSSRKIVDLDVGLVLRLGYFHILADRALESGEKGALGRGAGSVLF